MSMGYSVEVNKERDSKEDMEVTIVERGLEMEEVSSVEEFF
jgi:hypothetical protein